MAPMPPLRVVYPWTGKFLSGQHLLPPQPRGTGLRRDAAGDFTGVRRAALDVAAWQCATRHPPRCDKKVPFACLALIAPPAPAPMPLSGIGEPSCVLALQDTPV